MCNRKLDKFAAKYPIWTKVNLSLNLLENSNKVEPERHQAGPKITFGLRGARGQRKQATDLSRQRNHNPGLLLQESSMAVRKNGLKNLATVLKILAFKPAKARNIWKWLSKPVQHPVCSTAEEALALIPDHVVTKDQYCAIQEDAKNRKAVIYPNYKAVPKKMLS